MSTVHNLMKDYPIFWRNSICPVEAMVPMGMHQYANEQYFQVFPEVWLHSDRSGMSAARLGNGTYFALHAVPFRAAYTFAT